MEQFKGYSQTFSSIADGVTVEQNVLILKDFEATQIMLAGNSTSTFVDTISLGFKSGDSDVFNPSLVPASALQGNGGAPYDLPSPIKLKARETLTIKVKNSTGSSLTTYVVVLLGKEVN